MNSRPSFGSGHIGLRNAFSRVHLTASVLCHDELRQPADVVTFGVLAAVQIILGAVDEANNVGILLDGSRFTKVA